MDLNEKKVFIDETEHDDLDFLKARCEFLYKKLERFRIENILLKAVIEKNSKPKKNESKDFVSRRNQHKTGKN
jgi:hypothetical protein